MLLQLFSNLVLSHLHLKCAINLLWCGQLNSLLLHLPQCSAPERSAPCKLCGVVIAWCWKSISCLNPGVFLDWPERWIFCSPPQQLLPCSDRTLLWRCWAGSNPVTSLLFRPKPVAQGKWLIKQLFNHLVSDHGKKLPFKMGNVSYN